VNRLPTPSRRQLAEGALAPKKILPTYKLLVDDAKPPIPPEQKELATHVADNPKTWEALLRRPFHTLKADGPFIFERADVDAEVADQLASLGDPTTTFRLGRPLRPLGSDLVIRPLGSDLSSPGVRPSY